mmetsp:Transcript_44344/g.85339  ORF Transcript_44344/g.85339 Transcript_44344/m.85339 type:complete len:455 (+) Transcript_44344:69-1433(+)
MPHLGRAQLVGSRCMHLRHQLEPYLQRATSGYAARMLSTVAMTPAPQVAFSNAKFKVGLCQTDVSKDKSVSLENAKAAVTKATEMGADLVVIGEMFACPYATKFFREYGERLVPKDVLAVLEKVRTSSADVSFEEAISCIDNNYDYRPVPFHNGNVSSAAGENAESAKIFSLSRLLGLHSDETLALFGEHYKDVKATPDGANHNNVRAFMKQGLAGLNFPDGLALTPKESAGMPTFALLSGLARKHKTWLVGGSLPELEGDAVYNTCLVFGPDGGLAAKHRKVHLFDIDVAATESRPAIRFKESDVLSAGSQLTLVDLPWCRVGVGICYDLRFPEFALALKNHGAKLLIYPGAFNMNTGPAHWSVLGRARAVDTQAYVAMVSPARSQDPGDYQAWGHTMLVNAWAEVVQEADHAPGVWIAEVDPTEVDRIREQVPTSYQKRADLYVPYADPTGK